MAAAIGEELAASAKDNGKGNGLLLYYHHYSFYSQKVVMALHEKKLPFRSHIINLTSGEQYHPSFLHINPRGEVPVLRDGVKVIPDSERILDYLEDNFSNGSTPRLIPTDQGPEIRQKVLAFRQMLDQLPSGIITTGSFYHPEFCQNQKPPFIRPVRNFLLAAHKKSGDSLREHAANNPEHRAVLLNKAEFQDKKHSLLTSREEYVKVLAQIDSVLTKVEAELASHSPDQDKWWLCSDRFTAADIGLAILLDRLNRLGLEGHFWEANKKPLITEYYKRVQERDSYKKTIPTNLVHLQTLMKLQSPIMLGIGLAAAVAVVIGGIFYYKRSK